MILKGRRRCLLTGRIIPGKKQNLRRNRSSSKVLKLFLKREKLPNGDKIRDMIKGEAKRRFSSNIRCSCPIQGA